MNLFLPFVLLYVTGMLSCCSFLSFRFYQMFSSIHIYHNSTQEVRESAGLAFSTLYKVFELKPVLNFWYYGWFIFFFFFLTYSPYIECWAASHWWDCPHIATGFGRWWYICNSPWWSKADFKVFLLFYFLVLINLVRSDVYNSQILTFWCDTTVSEQQLFCPIYCPN